jgi:hypothetical protein
MADTCGWCKEPAVTEVITRPGTKLRKTAPVCEAHAKSFEGRGQMTVRLEASNRLEMNRSKAQWKRVW